MNSVKPPIASPGPVQSSESAFPLTLPQAILLAIAAAASFQLAFSFPLLSPLVLVYLGCLFALRCVATPRQAFYLGLFVGMGVFVPQMSFLWAIFGVAAVPLWLILAFFHGGFLLLLQRVQARWGAGWAALLAPVIWCGIEYFRSEVWWLRFSWFSAASPLANQISEPVRALLAVFGLYGTGWALFALVTFLLWKGRWGMITRQARWIAALVATAGLIAAASRIRGVAHDQAAREIKVAGLQLEFPGVPEVLISLDRLVQAHPEAELLMLSEYTFDGPVPDVVRKWCRKHGRWLIAGGKQPIAPDDSPSPPSSDAHATRASLAPRAAGNSGERFFNSAFVVNPNGEVVFSQAKARPIQFFRDGEPATEQRVWDSPWGPLGILICYDASYQRVSDQLVRQGARALLIPAMDVEHWGEHQHWLDSRVTGVRAAEHRVPAFRVASSGISQVVSADGRELASAPFPGPGAMISGALKIGPKGGSLPWDRWLAPLCLGGTLLLIGGLAWPRRSRPSSPPDPPPLSNVAPTL